MSKSAYARSPQPTQVRIEFLIDKSVHSWLTEQAKANGATLNQLVQELLIRGIAASAPRDEAPAVDSGSPPAL